MMAANDDWLINSSQRTKKHQRSHHRASLAYSTRFLLVFNLDGSLVDACPTCMPG